MEFSKIPAEEKEAGHLKERRKVDTLLGCLLFLAKYYKRETSPDSLTFGLALHNKLMDLNTFYQAAKKIGLIPKSVTRSKIKNISQLALPSILLLDNERHCVLLEVNYQEKNATVIMPGLSEGETVISLEKLEMEFTGNVIIIKPTYDFQNRIQDSVIIPKPKKWFWGTMRRNADIYSQVVIASIFINVFALAMPLFTMNVYDRVLPNNAMETLMVLFIGISVVMVFDVILTLLRSYFLGVASKRADVIMSNKIFDQILNIKIAAKPASTGQFITRIQSFENVREFFTSATVASMVDLPFVILFLLIIAYIGGPLVYITLGTIIISILFSLYMQRPLKKIIAEMSKEDEIKQTTLIETVTGLEIVKNVRAQSRMKTHWENSMGKTVYYAERSQFISQTISTITGFLKKFSNIAIVAGGVYFASIGEMTMGAIIAAMMLNGRALAPASKLVSMITRFDKTMIALNNIDEIMNMPVEKQDKAYISRQDMQGDIELKDVNFGYKGQNMKTLKNINLTIRKGEKVAILGKIGSGKSTLLKVMLNLYEPDSGSVLVDNTDTRQIDPVDLRKIIGVVPQEAFLFMGTIKDNITIGEQFATDDEILRAANIAGLGEFLGKHEAGFDLKVGERGEGLSGGERQSVTLARALISDPNVLMLDEPTNSMDRQTEKAFIKKLDNIVEDKTLIVVTHKTSLLSLVDRVIIMENGQIITDGPKDEIFKSKIGASNV